MNYFPGKTVLPCILISVSLNHAALAADFTPFQGHVNMQGTILDAACAIAAGSREQVIDLDIFPTAEIVRNGQGISHPFSIELINCLLTASEIESQNSQRFQMTFDGETDGKSFSVQGEAKGIALQIIDDRGNIATPGAPLSHEGFSLNEMQLSYSLRLISNNQPLHAGAYSSAVRFKLDYY
ncbi:MULTISPECIES: fimbrial protein [Serratia]|jgi:P pilus assembly protein, pilin FimA|uniref:fimbrial protein n=1 Tax=Serratia TaxID=613 RepID=UPI0018A7850E|nr:fimbrial protein [Serratia marcescens]MBF8219166.1 type 1 fimbrial protein [Serratia ureilytica]MBF8244685.1 type 1 fimbrial protein [Serratia ureilytica]MBH1916839.1 type 1 fimbrial protein [Serratia marcescens]MBH2678182.1 type 1 fimbrial protein [Serratia marcescens]MBN3974998.1 type 1 fimbrial protein [Serratia marcescens]